MNEINYDEILAMIEAYCNFCKKNYSLPNTE